MENKKKTKWYAWILRVLRGDMLKLFAKHINMIILVVGLLFFYISNHYSCIIKLREIDRLQLLLNEVKSEALNTSVQLTGNTRPSQVEDLVKRLGLDIEKAKTPPYKLHK